MYAGMFLHPLWPAGLWEKLAWVSVSYTINDVRNEGKNALQLMWLRTELYGVEVMTYLLI